MIKKRDIICFSSIDWNFIWQGHQEIMSRLADNGNRVLFVENTGVRPPGIKDFSRVRNRLINWLKGAGGIRQEKENLFICSPILLPFPYSRLALWINSKLFLLKLERWIKIMGFEKPIIWAFLPTPLTLSFINNIHSELVIYYCIDNFRVSSSAASRIGPAESGLIRRSDLVFVTSQGLFDYCSQFNQRVHLFPFAVNYEFFEAIRGNEKLSCPDLKDIPAPRIGYIGGIHKWIDLNLIRETAKRMPDCSFVLVGPIQTDISQLAGIKNIYLMGKREHRDIPAFIKEFDICIIPYLLVEYTNNVYPTKLNEYLALGKPVISTALPEVISFNRQNDNLVAIAGVSEELTASIRIIASRGSEEKEAFAGRAIACAKRNSWQQRIEEMSAIIDKTIQDKEPVYPGWNDKFLMVFRKARRNILVFIFIALSAYAVLFYTPVAWSTAKWLKISDSPSRADAIIVFAGGVGETGKATQGYEERVEYAVKLYKAGFAKHLVFSSGYSYYFKEPLIMQALAVSLGVPEENIILEDKANNTYKNVLLTKEIIDSYSWKKILLVSVSYHMRRVSLVVRKFAPDLEVVYTPVPQSIFYRHGVTEKGEKVLKQLNLSQLKALIHEYLGIVFYWLKGWI